MAAYFNGFCKDEERNEEKEHCIHKASYDFRSDVTKEGRREGGANNHDSWGVEHVTYP